MDSKRFEQQKAFILEADKEKNILRQTHLSGHGRRENDAEHAWHMAMMAYLLKEYSNEPIDIARTMIMCLIHDIVEIDAGDTYAYDEEGKKTQRKREEVAAERIFGLLPEDQREELRGIFEEFEAAETKEAKFARAMDNLQPLLLNDSNGGEDWRNHQVTYHQVRNRQDRTVEGSAELYEVTREIIDRNLSLGNLTQPEDKLRLS
jgi:putative hydrolase of HD superfamily